MNPAAAAPPSTAAVRSLPPLGGRLLAAYRAAWAILVVAAIAVVGQLVLSGTMDPAILALRLVKAGVLLSVSTILFRRRQSDGVAAMLSLAFLLWTITSSFDFAVAAAWWLPVLDRLRFLLFALSLLLFPRGEWSPAWTPHAAVMSVLICALGIAEALGFAPTSLFLPLAILCVLAAIGALLVRYRRLGETAEKQQLKWVALGLSGGITLILGARAGAALMTPLPPTLLEGLFQLGIVVIALGFLISLLRYRLYDAETVISRSAAYALLTLSLVATFAGSEALIEMLGQQYFGSGIGSISGAMAAAVAAVLLSPINGRITAWAERHFQRDLLILKEHLPELLAELSATSATSRVGLAVLPRIEEALHSVQSALLVDGRLIAAHGIESGTAQRWAESWQAPGSTGLFNCEPSSDFPLRMALKCPFGSVRGWLLLGSRPDGSLYGRDELDALTAVAPALRRALFAAREREKEKESDDRSRQLLNQALLFLANRQIALEQRINQPQ